MAEGSEKQESPFYPIGPVKTPHRKREDFAKAQIGPVVRRQADLISLAPERERGRAQPETVRRPNRR